MALPSSTSLPVLPSPPPPLLPSPDGFLERPGAVYVRRPRKAVPPNPHAILVPPPPPPPPPSSASPLTPTVPFIPLHSHPAALWTADSRTPSTTTATALTSSPRSSPSILLSPAPLPTSPSPSTPTAVSWWPSLWSGWTLPPSLRFLLRAVALFGVLLGVLVAVRYALHLRERKARRVQRLQRQRQLLMAAQAGASSLPSLAFEPGCPHCALHAQQLQLLRRLCQLIAARLARLQGTAVGLAVERRKQRLTTSPVVAYTESEAAVVAVTEELEEAAAALGQLSVAPAGHQRSDGRGNEALQRRSSG